MEELDYGAPRGDEELATYRRIVERCFDMEPERSSIWLAKAGSENVRVLRRGGRIAAGLLYVDMAQYYGGARVPMIGIAAVGVPPEARGSGLATELMRRAVREVPALGRPLSVLYPATLPLYRRAGYEQAGSRFLVRADAAALPRSERELEVRAIEESDAERVEAVYEQHASTRPGFLVRGSYVWHRVRTQREQACEGILVERDGRVEGYLYLSRVKRQPLGYDLALTDLVAVTAPAAQRLLTLLADHRSIAGEVRWYDSPAGPFVSLLPERGFRLELDHYWMLRVCDVRAALEARGYPLCRNAELHLELADDVVAENAGRFMLRVESGRAHVEPGGRGELALPIGGLAALYSGFQSAETLAATGRAHGAPDVLRLATALFAGPAPGMVDMF